MKRTLLQLLLGAGLLAPTLVLAQEKPSLNSAPPAPAPVTPAPAPAPVTPAPAPAPTATPAQPDPTAPAATTPALPTPSYNSPSGLELPQREQERKAAQQHSEMYSKLFIYSGIGLNYGSSPYGGVFNFSVSPALGYRLNDVIAVGPGISYAYTNYSFGSGHPSLNLNSVGVKVFGQIKIYKEFLLHGEYEVTNAELPVVDANGYYLVNPATNQIITGKRAITSPLAGIGYRSQISNRAAADFLVLYNFNNGYNNSIYDNPVIRVNFLFNIGH